MEPEDITQNFRILRKCQNKFDCLIFEMIFIKELKPTLNTNTAIQFAPNYMFRAVLAAIILFLFFSIVCIFTHFYILYHMLVLVTFLSNLTCFNIFMLI